MRLTRSTRGSSESRWATSKWRCAKPSARYSNAWSGSSQANWQPTSCRSSDTWSSSERCSSRRSRRSSQSRSRVGGWWSIDGQRDDVRAADDGEANGASLLSLGNLLGCAGRGLPPSSCAAELFSVGEDEVHVLGKRSVKPLYRGRMHTLSNASICPTICLPS